MRIKIRSASTIGDQGNSYTEDGTLAPRILCYNEPEEWMSGTPHTQSADSAPTTNGSKKADSSVSNVAGEPGAYIDESA